MRDYEDLIICVAFRVPITPIASRCHHTFCERRYRAEKNALNTVRACLQRAVRHNGRKKWMWDRGVYKYWDVEQISAPFNAHQDPAPPKNYHHNFPSARIQSRLPSNILTSTCLIYRNQLAVSSLDPVRARKLFVPDISIHAVDRKKNDFDGSFPDTEMIRLSSKRLLPSPLIYSALRLLEILNSPFISIL